MRNGNIQVWPLPPAGEATPDWLAPLAEAVVGWRLDDAGVRGRVLVDELAAMRSEVPPSGAADGSYGRWWSWFWGNREKRAPLHAASADGGDGDGGEHTGDRSGNRPPER